MDQEIRERSRKLRNRICTIFELCFVLLVLTGNQQLCQAGALYLTQIATPGSDGTAGVSNVTNTFDASCAFTNPAGMTGLKRDQVLVGNQLLIPSLRFDSSIAEAGGSDGGNAGFVSIIPSMYGVKVLSDQWRLGLSVVAPLGGGVDYGRDFVGRYQANRSVLTGLGITPSVAYKINDRLSIGMGVSAIYTVLDLDLSVNQPGNLPDGEVNIDKIDDWSWQGVFGITYQLTDRALVGLEYRTKSEIELEGDLGFKNIQVPPVNELTSKLNKAEVDFDYAEVYRIGLRYDLTPNMKLFFDADYETWSDFSDNLIAVSGGDVIKVQAIDRDWLDTYHAGAGMVYRCGKNLYGCGVAYDSSPVRDRHRTADLPADRQLKLGTAFGRQHRDNLWFGFAGSFTYLGKGRMDQVAQGSRFKGKFSTNFLAFLSASLVYRF